MNYDIDIIIVGGGIVGCATAMNLLQKNPKLNLLLLEKESELAMHQTGRNSGVIHSGLYYKPGSLKAQNCREGYVKLINFCEQEQVPFEICGKIVVATNNAELPMLDELHKRGTANGLQKIRKISREKIKEIEPNCEGISGLFVPETGIVDYKLVTEKYCKKIKSLNGEIQLNEHILRIDNKLDFVDVIGKNKSWTAKSVVVCTGLQSDRLSQNDYAKPLFKIIPFRGEYYKLKKNAYGLVKNLIYPVPNPAFPFLGVHFTRMINGEFECGPNAVLAFGREAYKKTNFNFKDTWETITWPGFHKVLRKYWREGLGEMHRSLSKQAFVKALQKLVPNIKADDIEPAGSGIRAQACDRDGNLLDDFSIQFNGRVINVGNAPSPAATASLAIGNYLSDQVLKNLH